DKSSICPGDEIMFQSISTGTTGGTTYQWDFGPGATPATYDQSGPVLVKFTQPGSAQVSLTISENGLSDTEILKQIKVYDKPEILALNGPDIVCLNSIVSY